MDASVFLSIIIPVYNEQKRVKEGVEAALNYCADHEPSYEVVVVDDGSQDETLKILNRMSETHPNLRVVAAPHGGKGWALRQGVFASQGQWLFLCDVDFSMPVQEIERFKPAMERNAPVIIASRELRGSIRVDEPAYRHLMGRVFNFLVRMFAVKGIQDTQCGFKCFRRDAARNLFSLQRIYGWGFDVELLFVAQKHGYTIEEVPITWYYRDNSKVQPVKDTFRMLDEIFQVRRNNWKGFYNVLPTAEE